MKILVIPDIHGTHEWKRILPVIDKYEKFIFLGDYFDNWTNEWPDQMDNFLEIINLKKSNPDKIDLLIANHDTSYILDEQCSGYQPAHSIDIAEAFRINKDLFEIISVYDQWIFVHGGVSEKWMKACGIKSIFEINQLYKERPNFFRFVGPNAYGDNVLEGPLWIRPASLMKSTVKDYNTICGHTEVDELKLKTSPKNKSKVLCIDSRDHSNIIELDTKTNDWRLI